MGDPDYPLAYALFHLTPTRTRCDLVVFSVDGEGQGQGQGEKIASGLVEPFLSHMGYAKDEIPKGGYSLTLRPPKSSSSSACSWFTKSTLERFVRFVSTPEILERVVTIEREIQQIERSMQPADNDSITATRYEAHYKSGKSQRDPADNITHADNTTKSPTLPSKQQSKTNGCDPKQGENSKLCLQRVLETRKVVLQKEQGMAYARASVAGFQLDHIDDLLLFADAFAASRLREACLNYKDLCKKKQKDKMWIEELAAMEAYSQAERSCLGTSGIMLTSESLYNQSSKAEVHEATGQFGKNGTSNGGIALTKTSESLKLNQDNNSLRDTMEKTLQTVNGDVDGKPPFGWPNHLPAHVYDIQTPDAQDMSSNQGYVFPGMQLLLSPYYQGNPGNMLWHQHVGLQDHRTPQNADHQRRNKKLPKPNSTKSTTSRLKGGYGDQSSSDLSRESEEEQGIAISSPDKTMKREGINNRRPKNKRSNKVVIRNINYISSKRKDGRKDESSDESLTQDFLDKGFLIDRVENVVGTIHKHQKSGRCQHKEIISKKEDHGEIGLDSKTSSILEDKESWQDFQNILMKQDRSGSGCNEDCNNEGMVRGDTHHQVEVEDDYCLVLNQQVSQRSVRNCTLDAEYDSTKNQLVEIETVITERDADIEYASDMKNFVCEEDCYKFVKRTEGGSLYMKNAHQEDALQNFSSDHAEEASAPRSQRGGDCLIVNQFDKSPEVQGSAQHSMYESEQRFTLPVANLDSMEENEKKLLIDDSFVVPTRSARDDTSILKWEMDIGMVSGSSFAAATGQTQKADLLEERVGMEHYCEPDDLQMVLEREYMVETACWTHEIDYAAELTSKRVQLSIAESNLTSGVPTHCKEGKKHVGTETKTMNRDSNRKPLVGYLGKSKSQVMSANRKPPTMSKETLQRSKREKEEENRRRIEESLAERQKRIAQKSGSKHIPRAATGSFSHNRRTFRSTVQVIERSKLHKSGIAEATKDCHINEKKKQNGGLLLSKINKIYIHAAVSN